MKSFVLAGAALIALLGGAATAADLPVAAPIVPVYRTPMYWTACYVGGNVGTAWSWASLTDTTGAFTGPTNDLGTQQTAGLAGGVQGGCDYQVGSIVFGIQGMWDGGRLTGNTIWQPFPQFSNSGTIPWFATVTGRVGVTFVPAAMFYAKLGVAALHHDYSRNYFGVPVATGSSSPFGWTAGIGVEWIFAGNWSLFAEYAYLGFGRRDVTFTLTGAPAPGVPAAPGTFPLSIQENINAFIVGSMVKFRRVNKLAFWRLPALSL